MFLVYERENNEIKAGSSRGEGIAHNYSFFYLLWYIYFI